MDSILYERIKSLCKKKGITVSRLETELGFGTSSIKKWEKTSSPSIDKVMKVASYFDVSVDYLLVFKGRGKECLRRIEKR